jgi:hypothetical protein
MYNSYVDPKCGLPCPQLVNWTALLDLELVLIEVGDCVNSFLLTPVNSHVEGKHAPVNLDLGPYSVKDFVYGDRRKQVMPTLVYQNLSAIFYCYKHNAFYQTSLPVLSDAILDLKHISYKVCGTAHRIVMNSVSPHSGTFFMHEVVDDVFDADVRLDVRMPDDLPDLTKLRARALTLNQLRTNWESTQANSAGRKRILAYLKRLDCASRYILIKRMVESDGVSEDIQ